VVFSQQDLAMLAGKGVEFPVNAWNCRNFNVNVAHTRPCLNFQVTINFC